MTIASISISPFEGFGIKNEAKEASREAIHEAIGSWIDEVVEMSVPGKIHNSQQVKIQPEERLAATSDLDLASCLVTGSGEAMGWDIGLQRK